MSYFIDKYKDVLILVNDRVKFKNLLININRLKKEFYLQSK